jgi:cbb3-type cytochrome oxidase maturation protein
MTSLLFLIPASLCLGGMGPAFLWALNSGQYEDLEGAALRVIDDADVEPADAGRRIWPSRD